MTKKKTILILSPVLVIASALAIYVVFKFKLGKKILCYPSNYNRDRSNLVMSHNYYFKFGRSVYYHYQDFTFCLDSCVTQDDLKLMNSDPLSFTCIDSNYAKDRNNVYYRGLIVEQADPDTFEPLDWPRARDKNYYFKEAKIEGVVSENEFNKDKTSYELMRDLIISRNSDNSNRVYGPEYYKIFQEVKSPFDSKIAVLFGLDPEKAEGCCSMPIGIFINDNGKIGKEFKILTGALHQMYLDNADWQSNNVLNYDFVIADEGGKTVKVETLNTEKNDNSSKVEISKLFAEKYNKDPENINLYFTHNIGTHIRGTVSFAEDGGPGSAGYFFACIVDGKYKIIFSGHGVASCELLEEYGFPQDMIVDACHYNQ